MTASHASADLSLLTTAHMLCAARLSQSLSYGRPYLIYLSCSPSELPTSTSSIRQSSTRVLVQQPSICLSRIVSILCQLSLIWRPLSLFVPLLTSTFLTAKFPSSEAFDLIADGLKNESDRKDAVKQGKAIFAFTLKNTDGEEKSWYLDLKNKGEVGLGTAPSGQKANGMPWNQLQTLKARLTRQ